jgi:RimJ/RimL family protein N-acetyltransferase
MPVIETRRLVLREFELADAAFAFELLNEPAFLQNIGDRGVRSIADAIHYIQNGPRASYAALGFGHYVVELKATGEAVGMCGLRTREGLDDPDLGYAFLERHRSRGYASEAARAVLEFSRTILRIPRITAICAAENAPSIAILGKLGFAAEGRTRLPGESADVLLLALGARPAAGPGGSGDFAGVARPGG